MAVERELPPDVSVEPRGLGDERHVLLDIEGSQFELHPDDAVAIGQALQRVGGALFAQEEPEIT